MQRRGSTGPTEAEIEVLQVLWSRGPSTVREVHETLQADRQTSMTTTLKILQVMLKKGLVTREEERRPHKYTPTAPEEETQLQLLDNLIQRAFGGSARKMLVQAVRGTRLSREELREIRKLIESLRKKQEGQEK